MVYDKYIYGSSSYRARLPYFARNMVFDTWLLFLICVFPILQYKSSVIWLLLHLDCETISQHPIVIIDSQRRGPHNSEMAYGLETGTTTTTESFQYLLLQYSNMYKQYSAFQGCHFQELISFLTLSRSYSKNF